MSLFYPIQGDLARAAGQHARAVQLQREPRYRQNEAKLLRILAGGEHEADLCGALTGDERTQLAQRLRRIADQQGLTPGVHPGFRRLGDQK